MFLEILILEIILEIYNISIGKILILIVQMFFNEYYQFVEFCRI